LLHLDVGVEEDAQIVEHLLVDRIAPRRQPQHAIATLERKHACVFEVRCGELFGQRYDARQIRHGRGDDAH